MNPKSHSPPHTHPYLQSKSCKSLEPNVAHLLQDIQPITAGRKIACHTKSLPIPPHPIPHLLEPSTLKAYETRGISLLLLLLLPITPLQSHPFTEAPPSNLVSFLLHISSYSVSSLEFPPEHPQLCQSSLLWTKKNWRPPCLF